MSNVTTYDSNRYYMNIINNRGKETTFRLHSDNANQGCAIIERIQHCDNVCSLKMRNMPWWIVIGLCGPHGETVHTLTLTIDGTLQKVAMVEFLQRDSSWFPIKVWANEIRSIYRRATNTSGCASNVSTKALAEWLLWSVSREFVPDLKKLTTDFIRLGANFNLARNFNMLITRFTVMMHRLYSKVSGLGVMLTVNRNKFVWRYHTSTERIIKYWRAGLMTQYLVTLFQYTTIVSGWMRRLVQTEFSDHLVAYADVTSVVTDFVDTVATVPLIHWGRYDWHCCEKDCFIPRYCILEWLDFFQIASSNCSLAMNVYTEQNDADSEYLNWVHWFTWARFKYQKESLWGILFIVSQYWD